MTTVIHDTTVITPMGADVRVLPGHSLVLRDGRVAALAPASEFAPRVGDGAFDDVIRGHDHLVIPGLVNTHHHLYQSLTRCLPGAQNDRLFDWLTKLYEPWRRVSHRAVNLAAKVSIAELLLSGCTTTVDHFYLLPPHSDVRVETVLMAAEELGIRIHLGRGSMTLGQSHGGLPPDDIIERDADVLADCERVLDAHHDPDPYALRRIDLAPCSPFNVTPELLRDTCLLARERGVLLHTHVAETREEEAYCLETFGRRPVQAMADLGWLGSDVYLAHCVQLNDAEIDLLARTQTGVSHNPTSNMRLGSGIAPVEKLLRAEVRVGLGVDGSSSNDGGSMLSAARHAWLAARTLAGVTAQAGSSTSGTSGALFSVADAFRLATTGGAACLHRDCLGHLNPGAAADVAMFRIDDIALAGAVVQDPVAALIMCDAPRADRVFVAGREVVRDGRIVAIDEAALVCEFNELVRSDFT